MCAGFEVGGDNVARSFLQDATATATLVGSYQQTCELRNLHLTECISASVSAWVSLSALRADCVQQEPSLLDLVGLPRPTRR